MTKAWHVAAYEWKMLRTDRAQQAAALVFLLVLVAAALLGASRLRDAQASVEALEARTARQSDPFAAGLPGSGASGVVEWGPAHPDYVGNDRGTYAVLPPAPLSVLAVGQADIHPDHYRITARLRESVMTGDQIEHPLWLLTGHLDLSFVILYLYPLLILAMTFDLTASERGSGTLRMLLAQPIALATVLRGKLLVRAIVLLLPVGVAPIVTLAVTGVDADSAARLGLWMATAAAYGGVWFGLALVVNAHGRSAATNALVLAGAWMSGVVLVPAAVNLVATVAYPVPSRVEFASATRLATQEAVVQGSRILGHFMEDHPSAGLDQDGLQQFAVLQAARDEEVRTRLRPVIEHYEARLESQRVFIDRFRYLSPTMLAHASLLDAAGTSGARHRHFAAEASRFQQEWQAFFEPFLLRVQALTADDYARLPGFTRTEEPVRASAARVAAPLVVLLLVTGVLVLWGARAYRTYDLT
jgi:ABC-2 type transport system permease protein